MLKGLSFLLIVFSINNAFAEVISCDVMSDQGSNATNKKVHVTFDSKQVFAIEVLETTEDGDGNSIVTAQTIFSRTYSDPLIRGGYKVAYCNPDESTVFDFNKNMYVYSNCVVSGTSDQLFFSYTFSDRDKNGEYSIDYLGEDPKSIKVRFASCK